MLQTEHDNPTDEVALADMKRGTSVGHIPYNLAPIISNFLKRSLNKGMAEITRDKVNRGGGYGLEAPCRECWKDARWRQGKDQDEIG